ncbi:hypothetical protein [Saccharothrix violaceirubra]|uniref:Uncharacterized protein n=1 Tax=Saccharothrix violaceirubra TaxID=413306 RepID=A0A7W7WWF2_9PSEU|nr:hypothetical protein [Saccharothrix violaceirubra]MBB4965927.1 hypothetical protein [Saccharothrix violaceirubra]
MLEVENHNVASDDARVEQQIGVQLTECVFHSANIYTVTEDDTAERRYEVALAYLAGGVPRRAEDLLRELAFGVDQTSGHVYHYVLSVFSDRGLGDLTKDLTAGLRDARKIAEGLPDDGWGRANRVVWSLFDHVRKDRSGDTFAAVEAFGRLPAPRQDEIATHLSRLVAGSVEQRLNAERKHQVGVERLSGDRIGRVWKYFEPDPAPPSRYEPRLELPRLTGRRSAVLGAVAAAVSAVGLFTGPFTASFWGGLAVMVAGCAVMGGFGVAHTAHLVQVALRREAAESAGGRGAATPVDRLIDHCFRETRPEFAHDWPNYAAGYAARLKTRFNAQLWDQDRVSLRRWKWLFDWHARRVADRWPHHDPIVRPEGTVPGGARLWQVVGVLVTLAGLGLLLVAAQRWWAVPLAVGGGFALPTVLEVLAARRAVLRPRREADALFDEENDEFLRWRAELADRPGDGEMARWLALDKAHLKSAVLRGGDIGERDLVSHVVLTQPAPGARRGSVTHGPPRYSAYLVTVILLTRRGVQASRVYLDFGSGEVKNEVRDVFGYDRIVSASLRMEDGRRVRRREFRLTLVNGAEIITVAERLDAGSDTAAADEAELERLAAETSGMDAALPVLLAVAREGTAWIGFELERQSLRSRDWE